MVSEPSQPSLEPLELRILKRQIANVKCSCKACRNSNSQGGSETGECPEPDKKPEQLRVDQTMQVDTQSVAKFDQTTETEKLVMQTVYENLPSCNHRSTFCPSCFVTMNLLRGGVALGGVPASVVHRVVKDEEVQAFRRGHRCDKGVDNNVHCVNKTTSYTANVKPPRKSLHSEILSARTSFESSSISSLSEVGCRKLHCRDVKFSLNDGRRPIPTIKDCVCAADFLNSIRPPMNLMW